jgi:hypothetical protein
MSAAETVKVIVPVAPPNKILLFSVVKTKIVVFEVTLLRTCILAVYPVLFIGVFAEVVQVMVRESVAPWSAIML